MKDSEALKLAHAQIKEVAEKIAIGVKFGLIKPDWKLEKRIYFNRPIAVTLEDEHLTSVNDNVTPAVDGKQSANRNNKPPTGNAKDNTMAKASAAKSAIELLAEMEAKHKEAVREIKENAANEIREKLKEAREIVKTLEDELQELTGLRGKVGSGGTGERRTRISSTTLMAVGESILKVLDKKTEMAVPAIAEKTGNDLDVVKAAIARLKREDKVKSNGKVGTKGAWLLK